MDTCAKLSTTIGAPAAGTKCKMVADQFREEKHKREADVDAKEMEPRRSTHTRAPSAQALRNIARAPRRADTPAAEVKEPLQELPEWDFDADKSGLSYEQWLSARMKLLPKKGDLHQAKNWRAVCLLDIASKILSNVLVYRMQKVQEAEGLEAQTGFRGKRGTVDGLFSLCVALQKRKEHNLETWALFIDLVKAFDTVSREALFAVLRKFGMPDHFICIVMRLHTGAVMKFKIGEIDSTVPSEIGVRQGSCEGPTLFLFIMQAALETMSWPVAKPQFCTTKDGKTTGSRWNRKRDVTMFELWASLFADDCALLF